MSPKVLLVGLLFICVANAIQIPGLETPPASKQFLASFLGANPRASGVGGGTECAGCTAIVAIVEQLAYIHDQPLIELLEGFCTDLPIFLRRPCQAFVEKYGGVVINMIELEETPDRVCQQLGVCTKPECSLFPPPAIEIQKRNAKIQWDIPKPEPDWEPLEWINRFVNDHDPLFDLDGDKFSTWQAFRGTSWRGRDCDDLRNNVYPGRRNSTYNDEQDQDCNGIFGHAANGTSWEDLYCSETPRFGQVILGDSAAAHFHIPLAWASPLQMTKTSFDDLIPILANELDWPEMSATTGYTESDWIGHPHGVVSSSYLKGLNQNRCAFRDYQNIGVNGARTSSMANTIMYSLARNQTEDYPVMLMYALIGNDVCNGHIGFDHMTTPEEFYTNVVAATDYLDTVLPMGSHVVFMGLADGLILWDAMNARIHPIGELRQDVTYADLYDYLNCLEISPCWGWLNSDAAVRNATQKRADELTLVYQDVIRNNSYTHFDMTFVTCPVREMIAIWEDMGGEAWQLIEPVDGFHPNQMGNALIADYIWDVFEKRHPELIPPLNPWNEEIINHFGNQGGY